MNFQRSSLDPRFAQAEAVKSLQDILYLARTHRDVADWLYNDFPRQQRGDGILSPEVFNQCLAVSTVQSWVDLSIPCQAPACLGGTEYSETFFFDLYVPVKESNGISVGYSFLSAVPKCGFSVVSTDLFSMFKTNRARYVYKKDTRTLLVLMQNTPTTDTVWCIRWTSDSQRNMKYCVIPHRQYSFDDQPSVVITFVSGESDLLCSSSRERHPVVSVVDVSAGNGEHDDEHHALPNGPADFVDGVWRADNINSLPQCIFHDLEYRSDVDRYYRDASEWLNEKQRQNLSRRHTKGLIQFETRNRRRESSNKVAVCEPPVTVLQGSFFCGHVIRETFDEQRRLNHRIAAEVRTRASFADMDCLKVLRRAASQIYYSVVLWASTDQHLVFAQEQSAAEQLWGKDEKGKNGELALV